MFSGFMVNAWIAATIVAVVAGVVGFFIVLRGSAFVAHAIPNGAFAGAAGASAASDQHAPRPRRLRAARRARHRPARPPGPPRRRHRARARVHARPRRALLQLQRRVRAGDLLAALRRGARHQQQRARRRPPRSAPLPASSRSRPVPPAAAHLGAPRGRPRRAGSRVRGSSCASCSSSPSRRR